MQGQWEGWDALQIRLPFSFLVAIIRVMMTAAQPQSEAKERERKKGTVEGLLLVLKKCSWKFGLL